jgi:hypothetical protein
MKKLLGTVVALGLAASASATVNFQFGSNWYFPRNDVYNTDDHLSGQGQNFGVNWDLENDLIIGAYTEITDLTDGYGSEYPFSVNAITVGKGVMKNASVGLHLGTFYEDYNGYTGMLTDVFGNVVIMGGSADKISGGLTASFGGRFAVDDYASDWSGYFINLGVSIGI